MKYNKIVIVEMLLFCWFFAGCDNGKNEIADSNNENTASETVMTNEFIEGFIPMDVPEIVYGGNIIITENENSICSVHNIEMTIQNVKIMYGYLLHEDGYWEYLDKRKTLFPNSDDVAPEGGCIIWDGMPRYAEQYVCEQCNADRDKLNLLEKYREN
ncbi:MAG: hypothetical protein Pg6C_08650 [Treponemataceae bacterium]|nr:MAG: hypothetical protein Pg6C_08650 [Treponemataceae bacterium]